MDIPTHTFPVCIDFNSFMDNLAEEKGYDYRDFGKSSQWYHMHSLKLYKKYNVDYQTWSRKSSSDYTENEKLLIKEIDDLDENEPEYLDAWHWMLDNCFQELCRHGVNYMSLSHLKEEPKWLKEWQISKYGKYDSEFTGWAKNTPDWINTILNDIFEACKDHEAFDGDSISFHIDW